MRDLRIVAIDGQVFNRDVVRSDQDDHVAAERRVRAKRVGNGWIDSRASLPGPVKRQACRNREVIDERAGLHLDDVAGGRRGFNRVGHGDGARNGAVASEVAGLRHKVVAGLDSHVAQAGVVQGVADLVFDRIEGGQVGGNIGHWERGRIEGGERRAAGQRAAERGVSIAGKIEILAALVVDELCAGKGIAVADGDAGRVGRRGDPEVGAIGRAASEIVARHGAASAVGKEDPVCSIVVDVVAGNDGRAAFHVDADEIAVDRAGIAADRGRGVAP